MQGVAGNFGLLKEITLMENGMRTQTQSLGEAIRAAYYPPPVVIEEPPRPPTSPNEPVINTMHDALIYVAKKHKISAG